MSINNIIIALSTIDIRGWLVKLLEQIRRFDETYDYSRSVEITVDTFNISLQCH